MCHGSANIGQIFVFFSEAPVAAVAPTQCKRRSTEDIPNQPQRKRARRIAPRQTRSTRSNAETKNQDGAYPGSDNNTY
jgi:hypothetical protein